MFHTMSTIVVISYWLWKWQVTWQWQIFPFTLSKDPNPNLEPYSNASIEAYNISFFICFEMENISSPLQAQAQASRELMWRKLKFVFILLCSLAQSVKWHLWWLTLWLKLFRPPSYLCLVRAFYPVLLSCLFAGLSSVYCTVVSYRCGLAPSSGKRFLYS